MCIYIYMYIYTYICEGLLTRKPHPRKLSVLLHSSTCIPFTIRHALAVTVPTTTTIPCYLSYATPMLCTFAC